MPLGLTMLIFCYIFLLISLLLGLWVWYLGFLRSLPDTPICNLLKRNLYGNPRYWCSCFPSLGVGWTISWGEHAKYLAERMGYVSKLKRGFTEKSAESWRQPPMTISDIPIHVFILSSWSAWASQPSVSWQRWHCLQLNVNWPGGIIQPYELHCGHGR